MEMAWQLGEPSEQLDQLGGWFSDGDSWALLHSTMSHLDAVLIRAHRSCTEYGMGKDNRTALMI